MTAYVLLTLNSPGDCRIGSQPLPIEAGISVAAIPEIDGQVASGSTILEANSDRLSGWRISWEGADVAGQTTCMRLFDNSYLLDLDLTLKTNLAPRSIGWPITGGMTGIDVLTSQYRLEALRGKQTVDRWTPLVLRGRYSGGHVQMVSVQHPVLTHVEAVPGGCRAVLYVDHQASHPRFSFRTDYSRNWKSQYQYAAGQRLAVSLVLQISDMIVPIIVAGRYPRRYRAAMTITDHADHDTLAKWSALLCGHSENGNRPAQYREGFAGLGLRFTKSVYPHTPGSRIASIQWPEFKQLCHFAADTGIEICPHGVDSATQPTPGEMANVLAPFAEFRPRTWIDHGFSLSSNYTLQGWSPDSEYELLSHLDRLGIRYVWSFLDFGQVPPRGRLNQFAMQRFSGVNYLLDLPSLFARAMKARNPLPFLHGWSVLLFQLVPDASMSEFFALQRQAQAVLRRGGYRAIPALARTLLRVVGKSLRPSEIACTLRQIMGCRDEYRAVPLLYPEHHSAACGGTPRWLFSTVGVHDVVNGFAPHCIDELIDEYGLHIAHTYMSAVSRTHLGHAVEPHGSGEWQLTPGFAQNLRYIAERFRAGDLLFAPLAELGDQMAFQRQLKIVPVAVNRWRVTLPTDGQHQGHPQIIVYDAKGNVIVNDRQADTSPFGQQARLIDLSDGRQESFVELCPAGSGE
ncbi:MAG: hypothetical protein R3E01_29385 [Pirellulaceae bacterium]|nr:hypothetical protein [Planctomycetales bacterium]